MTFKSFIRVPKETELFTSEWASVVAFDDKFVSERLARLSRRLFLPHVWPASSCPLREDWENPSVAAGYTYLAQFLAHDTIHSTVSTAALDAYGGDLKNGRSAFLDLQTLYGAGFDGCLLALEASEHARLAPSKLGLGRIQIADVVSDTCPFRDIPRGLARNTTMDRRGLQNTQIADDRNDNNALVSQVTMLFTVLHNYVVDLLHKNTAGSDWPETPQAYAAALFHEARLICIDVYRRIVRSDLMRTILHPNIYAFYNTDSPVFLDRQEAAGITTEYAKTLRFGHAMVRPTYRVNNLTGRKERLIDVLLTTSRGRPWRLPLDETWAVQWSNFFRINGSTPNFSRRIGPQFSADLLSHLVFDRVDATSTVGLAYRDLLNGASMPGWSVPALVAEIQRTEPRFVQHSRLLANREYREARLSEWLSVDQSSTGLTDEDVADLSRDPPLLLFVLFEAAEEMLGERLGTLGSVIVAETVFRILADAENRERETADRVATVQSQVRRRRQSASGSRIQQLLEISRMSDLICHIGEFTEYDRCEIPFV